MTKEQIRAAAINAANEVYDREECIEWEHLVFAFRDGAQWRINSVWHKPEEVPEANRWIIHLDRLGCRVYGLLPSVIEHWGFLVADKGITRWAYIEDLIPTEDETA